MSILFEINHPAHIHLFRNLAAILRRMGVVSVFLIKSEPAIEQLAKYFDLQIIKMGSKGKGIIRKYIYQLLFLYKTIRIAKKNKTNLGMGVSMILPLVSKYTRMDSICLDDDDMAVTPVFAKYANKASVILTPDTLAFEKRSNNHISYSGYHELAYLHPNQFVPDKSVLKILQVKNDEIWFVVRFNAFNAHHDAGEQGMGFEQKKSLVEKLLGKGKVFISTEKEIDPGFEHLLLPNRPELIHSFLSYATLYVGESQTMTSEAAVLGIPALKCNTFAGRLSIPNELEEKYGLCYSYHPENFADMLDKIDELLELPNLKAEWGRRRQWMLKEKIDVTAFLVWFIENYPSSKQILKENHDYQYNFK